MKTFVVILFLLSSECFAADSEIAKQSFGEFDQSSGKGWRALAEAGKYKEAAQLIVRYLAEAKDIKPYRSILNFHAAQCYANADEIDAALERLQHAYQAEEPASYAPLAKQWNAYVRGTIAFLNGDRKELEKSRDEVASGPDGDMKTSNVEILNRLIRSLGKRYREAYSGS